MSVSIGDWIATGVNGEHWAIEDSIFQRTYMETGTAGNAEEELELRNDIPELVADIRSSIDGSTKITIKKGDKWYLTVQVLNLNVFGLRDFYQRQLKDNHIFQHEVPDFEKVPSGDGFKYINPLSTSKTVFVFESL